MQTLHFPFFFLTTTVLESQVGYWTSFIVPAAKRRLTSSNTIAALSGTNFLIFCVTGLQFGVTF